MSGLRIVLVLAVLVGMATSVHASSIPHQPAADRCIEAARDAQLQIGWPNANGDLVIPSVEPLPAELRQVGERAWILEVTPPENRDWLLRGFDGGVTWTAGHDFEWRFSKTGENTFRFTVTEGYPTHVYHKRLFYASDGPGPPVAYVVDLCAAREALGDGAVVVALDEPAEREFPDWPRTGGDAS